MRGVDIRIDASWLLIAALVTWSYWERFDRRADHARTEAFVMAVAGALLFFGSLLAHELAHALEAQHRGIHVGGITLFLFGGVTETRFDVRRPVDEFALTAVGPFTSFVLAAGLGLVSYGAGGAGWSAVAEVTGLVAWLNLALGLFNLLPGAPLDGGRILRAAVWWVTGDRHRAIRVAARSGQFLGAFVLGIGLLQLFFVRGAFAGGLWLSFIGWFLLRAAAEVAAAELQHVLEGITVGELLDRRTPVSADAPVAVAVERFRSEDVDLLAVADDDDTVGVLGVRDVQAVDRGARHEAKVRDVMRPASELPAIALDEPASAVMERFDEQGVVLGSTGGRGVGIITPQRVVTMLRRAEQFGDDDTGAPGPG